MYCPNYYFGQTNETLLSIKLNVFIIKNETKVIDSFSVYIITRLL